MSTEPARIRTKPLTFNACNSMLTISLVRTALLAIWATGQREGLRIRTSVSQHLAWEELGFILKRKDEVPPDMPDFALGNPTMGGCPILIDMDLIESVVRFEVPGEDYPVARIVNLAVLLSQSA